MVTIFSFVCCTFPFCSTGLYVLNFSQTYVWLFCFGSSLYDTDYVSMGIKTQRPTNQLIAISCDFYLDHFAMLAAKRVWSAEDRVQQTTGLVMCCLLFLPKE